jgi:hypothetical protein
LIQMYKILSSNNIKGNREIKPNIMHQSDNDEEYIR